MSENLDKVTFEKALERLEDTVLAMEEGEVPLEELVQKFQEGTELLKFCNSKLDAAELKIEKLQDDGSMKPFNSQEDTK